MLKIKTATVTTALLAGLLLLLPWNAVIANFLQFRMGWAGIKWNLWKELILLFLTAWWLVEFIVQKRWRSWRPDWLDILIVIYMALGLFTGLLWTKNLYHIFVGAKYDFSFLWAFFLARHFNLSSDEKNTIYRWASYSLIAVLLFGLIQYWLLPPSIMTVFGYLPLAGGHTWVPGGALPMYHTIGEAGVTRRLFATFSGPNNYSFYLLWAIPFLWFYPPVRKQLKTWCTLPRLLSGIAMVSLVLTFSRSAYLGLLGMFLGYLILVFKKSKTLLKTLIWTVVGAVGVVGCLWFINPHLFDSVILRVSSSCGHFDRTISAFQESLNYPWGEGLGKAGPASCYFPDQYGGCLIPENWYLQVALEMGYLGLIIFLAVLILTARRLWTLRATPFAAASGLSLIGISIACLFLHAWEDAAASLTLWIILGLQFSYGKR